MRRMPPRLNTLRNEVLVQTAASQTLFLVFEGQMLEGDVLHYPLLSFFDRWSQIPSTLGVTLLRSAEMQLIGVG